MNSYPLNSKTNYNNYETRRYPDRNRLEPAGRSLCGIPYLTPCRSHFLVMVMGNIASLDCRRYNCGYHNPLYSSIHIPLSQAQT